MANNYSIDVHLYMEKGMYARLIERAQELGVPLSAVVRDAVVQYFEEIPEAGERGQAIPQPDDAIWQLPLLSGSFGALSAPGSADSGEGR